MTSIFEDLIEDYGKMYIYHNKIKVKNMKAHFV